MFIQWNDERHALGIEEIDNQHKELFVISNQIFDAGQTEEGRKQLIPLFKRLYAYTKYHFHSEEALFKMYAYPQTVKHKEIHLRFTEKIKHYLQDFRDKPNGSLDEPLDFLVSWIINHIQGDDKKYADYFKDQGIDFNLHFSVSGNKKIGEESLKLWEQKQLSMEIGTIDNQHKELVHILQQFNDLQFASEQRRHAFLPEFIKKLFYYSQYHFSYEEELMSKHNYPETLHHRALHEDFVLRIRDFVEEYKLNKETLNDEIIHFLKDWTINHILGEDGKYKKFLDS